MKMMRGFLVWYNNRDVVPFLEAIKKQFAFYRQQNIDMFNRRYQRSGSNNALPVQRNPIEHLCHKVTFLKILYRDDYMNKFTIVP